MRLKGALAAIGIAAVASLAAGLADVAPAEAGWCRGAPAGWCGPQPVRHYIYAPNYYNVYYLATFAPDPYPYVYMPRGYWPYYLRPYARYGKRYWAPRWASRGCCAPPPCYGCGAPRGYLK